MAASRHAGHGKEQKLVLLPERAEIVVGSDEQRPLAADLRAPARGLDIVGLDTERAGAQREPEAFFDRRYVASLQRGKPGDLFCALERHDVERDAARLAEREGTLDEDEAFRVQGQCLADPVLGEERQGARRRRIGLVGIFGVGLWPVRFHQHDARKAAGRGARGRAVLFQRVLRHRQDPAAFRHDRERFIAEIVGNPLFAAIAPADRARRPQSAQEVP